MAKSKIQYNPYKSIKEMAIDAGVTEDAVRAYIRRNNIDRRFDEKFLMYQRIRDFIADEKNRNCTYAQVAEALGVGLSTVKKYAKMPSFVGHSQNKVSRIETESIAQSIQSVSDNPYEIIANIVKLHLDGAKTFDADLTYGTGQFYKHGTQAPEHIFDKYAYDGVEGLRFLNDAFKLPDEQFHSVVIDLPRHIKGGIPIISSAWTMKESNKFKNVNELEVTYRKMMKQAFRLLKKGGKLVFKVQDIPLSGKRIYWASSYALTLASNIGFEQIDTFIQHLQLRPKKDNLADYAARIAHCYFYVFQKPNASNANDRR